MKGDAKPGQLSSLVPLTQLDCMRNKLEFAEAGLLAAWLRMPPGPQLYPVCLQAAASSLSTIRARGSGPSWQTLWRPLPLTNPFDSSLCVCRRRAD